MAKAPRELFVRPEFRHEAYGDNALPIDCGQTISQPYMVALMTQSLELSGGERVLEIGTGSGYQAAILAELAAEVVTIERHEELSLHAAAILEQLGYSNVTFVVGDGTLGWPERAPFDRIVVTAAARAGPAAAFRAVSRWRGVGHSRRRVRLANLAGDSPRRPTVSRGQFDHLSFCAVNWGLSPLNPPAAFC